MTQGVDLDLDHLTAQLARQLERALIAARRSAHQRAAERRVTEQRTAQRATGTARSRRDPATTDLAHRWVTADLAARWAVADALRGTDPATAQAWDERVSETGVDLEKVHRESEGPAPEQGVDPASELVTEHLVEAYSEDAAVAGAAGPDLVHDPSAAELITAASTDPNTPDPEPVLNPPAPSVGTDLAAHRDAEQDQGIER